MRDLHGCGEVVDKALLSKMQHKAFGDAATPSASKQAEEEEEEDDAEDDFDEEAVRHHNRTDSMSSKQKFPCLSQRGQRLCASLDFQRYGFCKTAVQQGFCSWSYSRDP